MSQNSQDNNVSNSASTDSKPPIADRFSVAYFAFCAAGLLLLAFGYWGAWISHPAAGLNILGIDLAEYAKFVPEVAAAQIPLKREVFFAPLLSLAVGLILLGTSQRPQLPLWLRIVLIALAIPTALAMLPPAWTPGLLRMPEFRKQVIYIVLIFLSAALSPLLLRYLPDWLRGIFFVLAGLLPLQALLAFQSLLPALEKLYAGPLQPSPSFYLVPIGSLALVIGGAFLLLAGWQLRRQPVVR